MPPEPTQSSEAGLTQGARIGRYVVLGLLGRGGMGEVYAAYDPELDRKIAVKLLRAARPHAEALADGETRLLREAQAIARLSHQNVVVVFDVGTFSDSVFIAMEFVEGHTVGYWLQARPRRWREVLDVFIAAGRGLVAAHAAGLVHRDFKPDNVMITEERAGARDGLRPRAPADPRRRAIAGQPGGAGRRGARRRAGRTMPPGADPDETAKLGEVDGDAPPPRARAAICRSS